MDHGITISSQADPLSPAPWQVSETISDSPSEPSTHPDSPNVSEYRETLSGRWGINLFSSPQSNLRAQANLGINIGELWNMRTNSGWKELPFNTYLYDKRLIIWETMDDGSGRHMVYCCHCQHRWGRSAVKYTPTSTFIAHLRISHLLLPCRESNYKEPVGRILSSATASLGRRSRISRFTLARGIGLGGVRAPGPLFNAKEYRKLIAIMVIETNSSF